ncbi:hypothetical protein [Amaricoccus tamworthensis]|uniref:hypothetical protein n=1 Tax=Amaricoccus tamworthensis TaxID=57002 RepID=UPI003C7C7FEF
MNRYVKTGLVPALLLVSATSGFAGVEETVALTDVPASVMEAAKANLVGLRVVSDAPVPLEDESLMDDNLSVTYEALGDVKITGANTETEDDGSVVYEIQGTVDSGRRIEIDIDPDANVVEIEIEFFEKDVPGAVLKSVGAKMPDFVPEFIEASHSDSLQVIGYEFAGKIGDSPMDIEVSADGRDITVADD